MPNKFKQSLMAFFAGVFGADIIYLVFFLLSFAGIYNTFPFAMSSVIIIPLLEERLKFH